MKLASVAARRDLNRIVVYLEGRGDPSIAATRDLRAGGFNIADAPGFKSGPLAIAVRPDAEGLQRTEALVVEALRARGWDVDPQRAQKPVSKTPAQLDREITAELGGSSGHRGSLAHRLELVESELRAIAPGTGGLSAREKAKRRRDLTEERDELKRQIGGKPASLPKWNAKRGWHGGDRRTLYLFSYQPPGGYGAPNVKVYPGDNLPVAASRECTVRVATRDEAERLWQSPLHSGWTVAP